MKNPFDKCGNGRRPRFSVLETAIASALVALISFGSVSDGAESRLISMAKTVDFRMVNIGEGEGMTFAITNEGNAPLTLSNFSLPNGFSLLVPGEGFGEEFELNSGTLTNTIAPGAWTNVEVTFDPTNVGEYGGVGMIGSDATGGSGEFTVSGEGVYSTGQFIGLFYPGNSEFVGIAPLQAGNVSVDNSGYFSAVVAVNGGFSGVLRLGGERYPFSGRLSPSGAYAGSIARKGMSDLGVSFQLNLNYLQGVISNETWAANLFAYRAIPYPIPENVLRRDRRFHHGGRPGVPLPFGEPLPGSYHFEISGSTNSLMAPTNNGRGTIKIAASYAVHLSGTLGDGTKFSQGTLSSGTQLPFYASLYNHQGAIVGWIEDGLVATNFHGSIPQITNFIPVTNIPPIIILRSNLPPFTNFPSLTNPGALPIGPVAILPVQESELNSISRTPTKNLPPFPGTNRISGTVNWFKPAQIDSNYPDGFSFQTTVSGPTQEP